MAHIGRRGRVFGFLRYNTRMALSGSNRVFRVSARVQAVRQLQRRLELQPFGLLIQLREQEQFIRRFGTGLMAQVDRSGLVICFLRNNIRMALSGCDRVFRVPLRMRAARLEGNTNFRSGSKASAGRFDTLLLEQGGDRTGQISYEYLQLMLLLWWHGGSCNLQQGAGSTMFPPSGAFGQNTGYQVQARIVAEPFTMVVQQQFQALHD